MDITIQGNNITVADNIAEYAQDKLEKLGRYLPNITSVRADIARHNNSRGRDMVAVQITIRHSRGAILRAEEHMEMGDGNVVKVAISNAVDKMYTRIQRFKGKRDDKRRIRDSFGATDEEISMSEEVPSPEELAAPDAGWKIPQIIRRKQVSVAAMNEEEAVEQMELLGHDFFMFFNADTNEMCVVYRRSNGGYGVLVPKLE
jgi:putative sigma-54 modulation protein